MELKTFVIEYKVENKQGGTIKEGKMKVHKKFNAFAAQTALESHLKNKYPTFERLIVVSCKELDEIYQLMQGFKDFFKYI